jgi:hypothetical protein
VPTSGTSPNASVPTGYDSAPVAGQQAGSVGPSGGLVDNGLPRTAAIAAGVGATQYNQAQLAGQAGSNVAGTQAIDPAAVQAGAAGSKPAGPAAWNDSWAKEFADAGAPSQVIQQLTFTGAMGADKAQLQQVLDQVKHDVDTQLATLAHDHPEEFKKLRAVKGLTNFVDGAGDSDRAALAKLAAAVEAGQLPEEQLKALAESAGKTGGQKAWDMLKPMLVYSFIPAWGALRIPLGMANHGTDPLTGEKLFDGKLNTAMTVAMGIGGSITLFNHARGAMQVAAGQRLAAAGGDAAMIAANEGVQNLTGMQKLASYIPGTNANRVYSGLARMDSNLQAGVKALDDGLEKELVENLLAKWRKGEVSIIGDPASKLTGFGLQPNTRGMVIAKNKSMIQSVMRNGKPTLVLDGRMTGKTLAAHLASAGVDFADDTAANGMLKTRLMESAGITNALDEGALKLLRERTLGNAANQLMNNGYIAKPGTFDKLISIVRPGPLQDAHWASQNLAADTLGKLHGTASIPKLVKFGIPGVLAVGGYFMYSKHAAAKAQEELAKQQQAAGTQGGAAGGEVSPEMQQALQQFAALPADQQQAMLQQQYTSLQQAAQQPNMTADQQAQLDAAAQEFELFAQVASGGAGAGSTTGGGAPAPAGTAPQQPAAPAGTGQFTAQGLGLA